MTDDEAKTKRCCGPEGCGTYEGGKPPLYVSDARGGTFLLAGQPRFCIGAACMAWRTFQTDAITSVDLPSGIAHVEKRDGGYCGLAGKP